MKKIKLNFIFLITILLFLSISCNDYLDTQPSSIYTESLVFGNPTTAKAFMYDVYNSVLGGYVGGNQGGTTATWESRTPNAVCYFSNDEHKWFKNEQFDKFKDLGYWGGYATIRKINMLIEKPQEYQGKGLSESEVTEFVAQGKLLRAMYYFPKARALGRIVYIDKVLVIADTTDNALKTKYVLTPTIQKSYELIVKDIEEAIATISYTKVKGTLNKWAAYALLSEVALTAAAYTEKESDRTAWLDKCINATDQLTGAGGYSLVPATLFENMFNEKSDETLNELIFAHYKSKTTNFECTNTDMVHLSPNAGQDGVLKEYGEGGFFQDPERFKKMSYTNKGQTSNGWSRVYPTENLALAYLMNDEGNVSRPWTEAKRVKNKVDIDVYTNAGIDGTNNDIPWLEYRYAKVYRPQSGEITFSARLNYTPTGTDELSELIYSQRDKRFYATFAYDGGKLYDDIIYTRLLGNAGLYFDGNGGRVDRHHTITNYYFRKGFYHNVEGGVMSANSKTDYHWVIFRLGRALLNKAEAQLWKGELSDALTTLNKTRVTHGELFPSTSATVWEDYITERRAELAYENDYYWSCLRWGLHGDAANFGLPPKSENKHLNAEPLYIQISPNSDALFVAQINIGQMNTNVKFTTKRYLFPIPYGELEKNSELGPQNKGWE